MHLTAEENAVESMHLLLNHGANLEAKNKACNFARVAPNVLIVSPAFEYSAAQRS